MRVSGPRAVLGELRRLFRAAGPIATAASQAAGSPPAATFSVRRESPRPGWHQIDRDGVPVWSTDQAEDVLASLEWAVNNAAVESLGARYLLFHAGAVARRGCGILLPAPAGSGKTTLVAGLIAAGFTYFSDEVGVLDPSDSALLPFAKSLCVKEGSHATLSRIYPRLRQAIPRRRFGGRSVWFLPPPPASAASGPAPLRYVVFPSYVAGASTVIEPLSPSAALARLMEQSFSLPRHGATGMRALVTSLARAECYTLTLGSVHDAVVLLDELTLSAGGGLRAA